MAQTIRAAHPTLAHEFMKWLNDEGKLLRIFTQNIDGLERRVGLPENKVIMLHGDLESTACSVSCVAAGHQGGLGDHGER